MDRPRAGTKLEAQAEPYNGHGAGVYKTLVTILFLRILSQCVMGTLSQMRKAGPKGLSDPIKVNAPSVSGRYERQADVQVTENWELQNSNQKHLYPPCSVWARTLAHRHQGPHPTSLSLLADLQVHRWAQVTAQPRLQYQQ